MAKSSDGDTVSLTTKLGSLSLGGKNALDIFLFISILALSGLTIYEHLQRSAEHDILSCQLKLTLFMQTQSIDKSIDWRKVPVDVYGCMPRFILERDQGQR